LNTRDALLAAASLEFSTAFTGSSTSRYCDRLIIKAIMLMMMMATMMVIMIMMIMMDDDNQSGDAADKDQICGGNNELIMII
jgi:hypothetical protein